MKQEKNTKERILSYAKELKMPVFRDEMDEVVAEANKANGLTMTLLQNIAVR